jgi:hypothetical protein
MAKDYEKVKERFAEAICAAQRLVVKPGQTARATFRVALIFKVKITIDGVAESTGTFDLSTSGFGAALPKAPAVGAEVAFEMSLTKTEPISGHARVAGVGPNNRTSFTFVGLKPAPAERLERILFDEMLNQLVRAAVRPG